MAIRAINTHLSDWQVKQMFSEEKIKCVYCTWQYNNAATYFGIQSSAYIQTTLTQGEPPPIFLTQTILVNYIITKKTWLPCCCDYSDCNVSKQIISCSSLHTLDMLPWVHCGRLTLPSSDQREKYTKKCHYCTLIIPEDLEGEGQALMRKIFHIKQPVTSFQYGAITQRGILTEQ